ncbi:hypothetical protein BDV95DRAFT_647157, partial [Massariosphaeria phaeospora]
VVKFWPHRSSPLPICLLFFLYTHHFCLSYKKRRAQTGVVLTTMECPIGPAMPSMTAASADIPIDKPEAAIWRELAAKFGFIVPDPPQVRIPSDVSQFPHESGLPNTASDVSVRPMPPFSSKQDRETEHGRDFVEFVQSAGLKSIPWRTKYGTYLGAEIPWSRYQHLYQPQLPMSPYRIGREVAWSATWAIILEEMGQSRAAESVLTHASDWAQSKPVYPPETLGKYTFWDGVMKGAEEAEQEFFVRSSAKKMEQAGNYGDADDEGRGESLAFENEEASMADDDKADDGDDDRWSRIVNSEKSIGWFPRAYGREPGREEPGCRDIDENRSTTVEPPGSPRQSMKTATSLAEQQKTSWHDFRLRAFQRL